MFKDYKLSKEVIIKEKKYKIKNLKTIIIFLKTEEILD